MSMRCAAIIVNYHSAEDTAAAAASIAHESDLANLIVIDNSADGAQADRLRLLLPSGARLFVAPRNLGFAAACNWAFRESNEDCILLLNPDARLLRGALPALIDVLRMHAQVAAVAPATWWDEDHSWLLPTLLPETPWQWTMQLIAARWPQIAGRRIANHWLRRQRRLHAADSPQCVPFLSGAVLLLRRRAIEAAGGLFDERFFMFYEDADLSLRLRYAGFRLALLPTAHAHHAWRPSPRKEPLMQESARRYEDKHFPTWKRHAACGYGLLRLPRAGGETLATRRSPPLTCFAEWRAWLGETRLISVSPSPLGYPAIFRPAGTRPAPPSPTFWDSLAPAHYLALAHSPHGTEWIAFHKMAS
ncbi:MAG: glycosyltransferase family 2 protein [Rhodocyclaceae bacterium]|nr:glycosyltransferase family 2 protein [Rhodocyclaceae bacterium]